MTKRFGRLCLALTFLAPLAAGAETYKCAQGGKTVISDVPCAAGAPRVDQPSDKVSISQKRQAEAVNQKDRTQLTELESKAARDRNYRGGINSLPEQPSPVAAPPRPAPAPRPYYYR
jgi:hypothetical protein